MAINKIKDLAYGFMERGLGRTRRSVATAKANVWTATTQQVMADAAETSL